MIGRLKHVAIAVPDVRAAAARYRRLLGASTTDPVAQPEHGVITVFVALPNAAIELMEPIGDDSPISGFLGRHPEGGIHHLCFAVEDVVAASRRLAAEGARVLGDGRPRTGAHGKPVIFVHPKDLQGTLVELEQE